MPPAAPSAYEQSTRLGGPVRLDRAVAAHRPAGDRADGHGQRDDAQEHPLPAEVIGDDAGERRCDQAREHPSCRQQRVHRRLAIVREGSLHQHVGERREPAGAGPLQRAAEDDDLHRFGRAGHDEPDDEGADRQEERDAWADSVGEEAGGHQCHQIGQRVRSQGHAIERVAAELVGDGGQRGDDRRALEGHERDTEHEADRQQPLVGIERGAPRHGRGHAGHANTESKYLRKDSRR